MLARLLSRWRVPLLVVAPLLVASAWPVGGGRVDESGWHASDSAGARTGAHAMDLSSFSSEAPGRPLDLVFLHHSIGGQLLADEGPDDGHGRHHPNGGGLRTALEANGYRVHTATYGSRLGEHTDVFDWLPKFRDHLGEVLRIREQDQTLPAGVTNRIVLFKSCFPNNELVGRGEGPGSPTGPSLTVENARAALRSLLPLFAAIPDTLFVHLTTPPLVGLAESEPMLFLLGKKLLGRPTRREKQERTGRLSRAHQAWVASEDGWLRDYAGRNVVVFDYYDVLTGGTSAFSRYASEGGRDPHPSAEGNRRATAAFVPFLNRAVRRAGLVDTAR